MNEKEKQELERIAFSAYCVAGSIVGCGIILTLAIIFQS